MRVSRHERAINAKPQKPNEGSSSSETSRFQRQSYLIGNLTPSPLHHTACNGITTLPVSSGSFVFLHCASIDTPTAPVPLHHVPKLGRARRWALARQPAEPSDDLEKLSAD